MASRPVPASVVAAVCLLLLGTAVVMALASMSLVGDGAYYLVEIIRGRNLFGLSSRIAGNAVRQAPVVAAVRLGVVDTHLLSVLLGVGQLVVPAAVWSLAVSLSRSSRLVFSATAMTAGLCAGTTWYFSADEVVLAAPLTVLIAVLLWRSEPWGWRDALLALGAAAILVASYEAVLATSSLLVIWALWRARCGARRDRIGAVTVAIVLAASIAVAVAGIAYPTNRTHVQSALYYVVSLEPWQFYVGLASIVALTAGMHPGIDRAWRRALLGVGCVAATAAIVSFTPTAASAFATRGGVVVAVFGLQLFLLWDWAGRRAGVQRPALEPVAQRWALALPVLFVAGLTLTNLKALVDWNRSLDAFQARVGDTREVAPVQEVLPPNRRAVVWGWTSSSLSLVVRREADAGVLVDADPSIVPFAPERAREEIADEYTWRR